MNEFVKKYDRYIRYVLIGIWNTVFWYAVFVALYYLLSPHGVHYMVVLIISQVLSVTNAYLMNKLFVFRTAGNYVREYLRFSSYYVVSFLANLVLLPLLVETLKLNPVISQAGIIIASIIISFFWHSYVTFAKASTKVPVKAHER